MAEQWPKDRPARTTGALVAPPRTERGTWTRFAVAVLIGLFALVIPALAPSIGHTGAVFTDREETSTEFTVAPDPATDPAQPDPAQPDPAPADPAQPDPAQPDPAAAGPAAAGPASAALAPTDPAPTGSAPTGAAPTGPAPADPPPAP